MFRRDPVIIICYHYMDNANLLLPHMGHKEIIFKIFILFSFQTVTSVPPLKVKMTFLSFITVT